MGRRRTGEYADETRTRSLLVGALLTLLGFALIIGSPYIANHALRDFARELGIAVAAVFTVSLIYELLLAKRYRGMALALVREAIATGEGNAAACERLGIRRIVERHHFENEHPIEMLLGRGVCRMRMVTRSAFYLLERHWQRFVAAIRNKAKIEVCILNPELSNIQTLNRDVSPGSIKIAVGRLDDIAKNSKGLPGTFERRWHNCHALDAFLDVDFQNGERLTTWELTFHEKESAEVEQQVKYVIELEPDGSLANLLRARYQNIWDSASDPTMPA